MEIKINKELEKELDKQFPKGDKARGRVLFAIAQMEIGKYERELKDLREAYNIAMKEITKLRKKLYGDEA